MPHSLSAQNSFRQACSRFATGITISTVIGEDGAPHGLTANSFTSVSMDPPLVLICIDQRANIVDPFRAAKHFGINVLESGQADLSNRFAGRDQDRFGGVSWHAGQYGVPLLDGSITQFECAVKSVIEAGDHLIFMGEVVAAEFFDGEPLLYFRSRYVKLEVPTTY